MVGDVHATMDAGRLLSLSSRQLEGFLIALYLPSCIDECLQKL